MKVKYFNPHIERVSRTNAFPLEFSSESRLIAPSLY